MRKANPKSSSCLSFILLFYDPIMSVDLPILKSVIKGAQWDYCVWEPYYPIVVIGRGGREEDEIFRENCDADGIPVYRRKTGGGAVALLPGMLVFSLARVVEKELAIREYSTQVNLLIIEFLKSVTIGIDFSIKGISDITIGDRKIMGSGMYRRKKILFFQGSILVDPDLSLMDRYLKMPPKQPDYRKGRSHADFMTTLRAEGCVFKARELVVWLDDFLNLNIERIY